MMVNFNLKAKRSKKPSANSREMISLETIADIVHENNPVDAILYSNDSMGHNFNQAETIRTEAHKKQIRYTATFCFINKEIRQDYLSVQSSSSTRVPLLVSVFVLIQWSCACFFLTLL